LLILVALVTAPAASGQSVGGVVNAVLALRQANGNSPVQRFDGRLYGGRIVDTTVTNAPGDSDPLNFAGDDIIAFTIVPRSGDAPPVTCRGTRAEFDSCVRANASALLEILFPRSLSESLAGGDVAINHAQQLMFTTVLGVAAAPEVGRVRRGQTGGRIEHEWFQREGHSDGDSGSAWQGSYQFDNIHASLEGRYAHQREDVDTRSTSFSADYHPSIEIDPSVAWRVGVDARSGFLYSSSNAFDFGSLDVGGGVWTSARKDYSRVRIGGGTLFQGSKSYVPSLFVGDDLAWATNAVGNRAIAYDLSYGGLAGFLVSERVSLNAKVMETRAVHSERDLPPTRLLIVGMAYLISGRTPIDFGYKVSKGGGLNAHSLFMQGNFRW
jgi:hypothetical protein